MSENVIFVGEDYPAVRRTVEQYVRGLEAADFDMVANCFTADAFYSHGAYDPNLSTTRAEVIGRDNLLDMLKSKRRSRTWVHELQSFTVADGRCYLEGVLRETADGPLVASYVGCGSFDESGKLTRWVAYSSRPPVGAALEAS
ncbi:nuclear transport factor 2 family protein [Burkholderia anthina]|uniref:nuclear transport factor 2 family protein n=1 Tax=Burkholderia anthina TaxID=179879 RepID=UPI001CF28B4D|nr:nuclear transport factor 2 family protein [Burkholderia anthina]MCA8094882.1 nuclear transport factor 2 family protein [Burkholderia anthina]